LHLGKFYPPAQGGIETHVQSLARGQAALGAQVEVVCVQHADAYGRDVTWSSLALTRTTEGADANVRVIRFGRRCSIAKLDYCPGLQGYFKALCANPPDILHLQSPNPTMVFELMRSGLRAPLVITHQSDVVRQKVLHWFYSPVERAAYERAKMIFTSSPRYSEGSALLQKYKNKVQILPMGIDTRPYAEPHETVRAEAQRLRETHGFPLWLSVGRLVYYKGLDLGLRALARVPGRWMVVGCGPLEKELKSKAAALGVSERVIWTPRLSADALVGAYHAATALWFPSNARSEAYGLVQVEAMASGCPVINTNIAASGVAWVCPDGVCGLTVPPNDAAAFAMAAQRLLDEPGLRERLAVGGRAKARAEFDQLRMAERSLELYAQARTA